MNALILGLLTIISAAPVSAAPPAAPPAAPLKVLVLDVRADSVSAQTARLVRDEVAVDMGRDQRLDVLSSEDLRQMVSVEAEKKAMGCDDISCLAEIGAALGARYIVHGSIGVLGSTTIVHLNLFDTEQQKSIARETAEAKNPDELLPSVRSALARVRLRMLGDSGTPVATDAGGGLSPLVFAGVGVGVLGVVGAGVGAALMGIAWPTFSNGKDPADGGVPVDDRLAAQQMGIAGTIVTGVGGAAVAGGVVLLALGLME